MLADLNSDHLTVFPEMRTALRTYHPVPSLQKTDGTNLQDAPRIKHLLKACLLPEEKQGHPLTTTEVLNRIVRSKSIQPFYVPRVSYHHSAQAYVLPPA